MSAATIITNATAGAPVLNGTEGSLSALFRYLAPILGWSIEFDNGPIIVVKPQSYKGGQALFYRIDDRAARGGAAPRVAEVRAYETMADINTGAGLVGPAYIHKSYYANTTGYPFSISGDQYGFFVNTPGILNVNFATGVSCVSYLGFNNPIDGEEPVCLLFGHHSESAEIGCNALYNASPTISGRAGLFLHKNRSGILNVQAACKGGAMDMDGRGIGSIMYTTSWSVMKTWPNDGSVIVAPVTINDGAPFSLRGFLPAFTRLSYATTGYALINGQAADCGTDGWGWGSFLISKGDDFRP